MAATLRKESGHDRRLIGLALDRQPGGAPILLAGGVLTNVGVSQRRQHTGGVRTGGSVVVPAVQDDLRVFPGRDAGHGGLDVIRGHVNCAGQMMLSVVWRREHFEEMKRVAAVDLSL